MIKRCRSFRWRLPRPRWLCLHKALYIRLKREEWEAYDGYMNIAWGKMGGGGGPQISAHKDPRIWE